MRKIILLLLCMICTIAYAQDIVRKVYPNASISKQHHMSFLGISLGNSVTAFDNALKQKGFKHVGNDYEDEHHFQGNLFGLKNFPLDICFDTNNNIYLIYSLNKYHDKNQAVLAFNRIKENLKRLYTNSNFIVRNTYNIYNNHPTNKCYWDVFSKDKTFYIGNIELSLDFQYSLNEYSVEIRIENVSNNHNEYLFKKYDISNYIKPFYSLGYLEIYPKYCNLILYKSDGTKEIFNEDEPERLEKFILDNNYTNNEKQYIFSQYLKKDVVVKKNGYICDVMASFNNIKLNYDRAKEEYENSPEHMSKGELWFCLWEGSANVEKYKRDGSYKKRVKAFVSRWNNFVDSGSNSNSTNWDNLNDAQKAVIHDHDNGR